MQNKPDFSNVKFGDKLQTRNGKLAVVTELFSNHFIVTVLDEFNDSDNETYTRKVKTSFTGFAYIDDRDFESDYDIIGYWNNQNNPHKHNKNDVISFFKNTNCNDCPFIDQCSFITSKTSSLFHKGFSLCNILMPSETL